MLLDIKDLEFEFRQLWTYAYQLYRTCEKGIEKRLWKTHEKNTIINSDNRYAQNVFESINDVLKNSPDLFVNNNTTQTTANSNIHRENITNLLNRRNFLNQSKQSVTNQANIEKSTSFIEVTTTDQLKKTTAENSVTS